jgi:malonyl CoA-acyl carrier protein transacylase
MRIHLDRRCFLASIVRCSAQWNWRRPRGAKLVQRLQVSIAAHSPLMQSASARFDELLDRFQLRPPEVPLIANISGRALTTVEELRQELSQQLTRPGAVDALGAGNGVAWSRYNR